jgi:threonine synthase
VTGDLIIHEAIIAESNFLNLKMPSAFLCQDCLYNQRMILPVCVDCGRPYPEQGTPYRCACGGIYDFVRFPTFSREVDLSAPGLWRYRSSFGILAHSPLVSLGEGNTPLVPVEFAHHPVWLKQESLNPTGSYKDRGSALLAGFLKERGSTQAVEDSSGNAGASFAAYAARANIQAEIYVPETASGPKLQQIQAYGAEVHAVSGPRQNAADAVRQRAESGITYASHAYLPFGLLGIATIAYELVEQLGGRAPGTLVAPVGHGGLLYGLMKGFEALVTAAVVDKEPVYVGVQSMGCAPVFSAYEKGEYTLREPLQSDTIAEGVRVSHPSRGTALLHKLQGGGGRMLAVNESDLVSANRSIAAKGFYIEPTSALVWAVLPEIIGKDPDPVVLILTGMGLKTNLIG